MFVVMNLDGSLSAMPIREIKAKDSLLVKAASAVRI
jgi:hypothetical protein